MTIYKQNGSARLEYNERKSLDETLLGIPDNLDDLEIATLEDLHAQVIDLKHRVKALELEREG